MSDRTIALLIELGVAIGILIAGLIIIKIVLHIERKALAKSQLDEALHTFILSATKITLWIILVVVLLGYLKVPTAPLVTVLGACGAAIALALKDSLGNIAGGILILINKPFSKGDTVDIAGTLGVVDSTDLLVTNLHTYDNKSVIVPNGTITTSVIVNYSREDKRRVDCIFGVGYNTDINKAKEILHSVADICPDVVKLPEPIIGVVEQGENSIKLDLKAWCPTDKYFDVKYFLEENVKIAFDEAGISIPYPQLDVHVVK